MAITSAVQKGSWIEVYDGSKRLFKEHGVLVGYTSMNVTVKKGIILHVYDEKGKEVSRQYI